MSERRAFQERLLPRTIEEALRIPFYEHYWDGRNTKAVTVIEALRCLPLLTRETFANSDDLLKNDTAAVVLIHSSGTTGVPVVRYRGAAELAAVAEVANRLATIRSEERRIVFSTLTTSIHGGGVPIPSNAQVIAIACTSRWLLESAVSLLVRHAIFPGVEAAAVELHGRPRHLGILARELMLHPENCRERIRHITSVGYPISRSLRRYLRRAFPSAAIRETYSLSEIIAGAERCSCCDAYHMDAPVIGEVIALDSDSAAHDSTGRLVVTELYPFSQLQPLIRYDTGDLVRVAGQECHQGIGFEYVGRKANTPIANVDGCARVVLSPWTLSQILEEMPGAARSPLGSQGTPPYDVLPMGPPYLDASMVFADRGPQLGVRVGIAFSPELHPEAAASFQAELVERLLKEDIHFRTAVAMGLPFEIKLCGAADFPPPASLGK